MLGQLQKLGIKVSLQHLRPFLFSWCYRLWKHVWLGNVFLTLLRLRSTVKRSGWACRATTAWRGSSAPSIGGSYFPKGNHPKSKPWFATRTSRGKLPTRDLQKDPESCLIQLWIQSTWNQSRLPLLAVANLELRVYPVRFAGHIVRCLPTMFRTGRLLPETGFPEVSCFKCVLPQKCLISNNIIATCAKFVWWPRLTPATLSMKSSRRWTLMTGGMMPSWEMFIYTWGDAKASTFLASTDPCCPLWSKFRQWD